MLQQTRVETVIPYYERFLARYPNVRALASANRHDVNAAWSGLGYYRRAKLMMDAAGSIVRDHDARLPPNVDSLRALPGFGRYTAGAVASIAFGVRAPAVDGNVMRVLSRIFAIEGDVTKGAPNARVWEASESLVRACKDAGDLNQALIELGATICTPRNPSCDECPVRTRCMARKLGRQTEFPEKKKRSARSEIAVTALVLLKHDRTVLLKQQPDTGLFANLWCLPMLEGKLDEDAIVDEASRKYGLELEHVSIEGEIKHVLTHRDIAMRLATAQHTRRQTRTTMDQRKRATGDQRIRATGDQRIRATALEDLKTLGLPSFTVRALESVLPPELRAIATFTTRRTTRKSAVSIAPPNNRT